MYFLKLVKSFVIIRNRALSIRVQYILRDIWPKLVDGYPLSITEVNLNKVKCTLNLMVRSRQQVTFFFSFFLPPSPFFLLRYNQPGTKGGGIHKN